MEETKEIKLSDLKILQDSYLKFNKYNKFELDKKKITKLRKKISSEKKEGHTHLLRTISLYTQEKDEHLKIYISKLYLQHFEN